ncbi:MAG: hydantoinase B/oxoprolinase family protein [Motiliproteus sp.]|nr:hydantoinase B/oxoprolinase family protein [Motiliproteus sp.]MCW9053997.1 hydantoinase B/oxoprolinase family protein [Motiliproteus sp.]
MTNQQQDRWQFWIDRGGTFTDVVARHPDGSIHSHKLLSENPEQYPDAAIQGIRDLLGLNPGEPIPSEQIASVKMGTTVATNALLERKGEPTLLLINKGFGDALRIGYQNRPHLFHRHIQLPELLYQRVEEIEERISAQGQLIQPLNEQQARQALKDAYEAGLRSVAIVLMHGYRYPEHEQQLATWAKEQGFEQISTSHQTSPLMKLVSRGDTTVVDAYLSPILRRYVDQVAAELGDVQLMFMQSNGGLVDARLFQGKDSILSGPAGGIVGAAQTSALAGFDRIIGFDMGGTSTDVTHYYGDYERAFETQVAGVRMRAPMMQIHTVAAGGGSILSFDGSRYRVGPESAGANPGPACYRRGGPLTVTDCNVILGKLNPDYFPPVFGPNADQPLDTQIVKDKFTALATKIQQATGQPQTPEGVAQGFLTIAVENMANAIKEISTQRGYDVTQYALCCFGGAGGQHACQVADVLGMTQIVLHPLAGVLSAYGMGLADIRSLRQQAVEQQFEPTQISPLNEQLQSLAQQASAEVERQGIDPSQIQTRFKAHLKYQGTDSTLEVPFDGYQGSCDAFAEAHRQRYGFIVADKPLIVEAISVEAIGVSRELNNRFSTANNDANTATKTLNKQQLWSQGQSFNAPIYQRDELSSGSVIEGPALIIEPTGTNVIEQGWQAQCNKLGDLVLRRVQPLARQQAIGTDVDPVMLEVFNNLFMSIAEQMGSTLENTSYSVNVKERLDFSCALFDGQGQLVANAPHMPVHLGSMWQSIQSVINKHGECMQPHDVYVLNAPYNGGTHLPDVTVITPVFDAAQSEVLFYVASRGHHADIGGITPGSMPPGSQTVDQEGVLIDNIKLVDRGRFLEQEMLELLTSGPYPARNPSQNIADLKAQIAANEKGLHELQRMINQFGLPTVQAYMQHVQDNAEESVRRVLDVLQDGEFCYPVDSGCEIRVKIRIDRNNRSASIDFSGSSEQQSSNFNAPEAVCYAAVLYVFRTLVDDEIPMNQGCLKPLDILIPKDSMLSPRYPAAVVAGNVETSQWITDALYGALGVQAGSQGTMNNFTFGNDQHQYYETICGGGGAGQGFDGTSAVQTHMTNSRLTDPEVLEWRYPVVLESFSIRQGSGGPGRWQGGNGVVRKVRFLEPMTAAILSSHRDVAPFGVDGGSDGQCGANYWINADGKSTTLPATAQVELQADDLFVIETPGGGGFGQE